MHVYKHLYIYSFSRYMYVLLLKCVCYSSVYVCLSVKYIHLTQWLCSCKRMYTVLTLIGLTRSEKTSVMATPKRLGAHIWQICLAGSTPQ